MAGDQENTIPDRLKKRSEFLSVRNGRKLRGPNFLVECQLRKDGGTKPRYGLTVSKKCGNAPQRNRIKRRLREAIRLQVGIDMAQSTDYVIVARRELISAPFQTIVSELKRRIASSS
jgi:ribonuclease P protein component